jgi:uncharacterized membrane protein
MALASVVVAVFDSHDKVDAAVKSLAKAGCDMKRLSVVGKDYETEEQVLGYYNAGDRVKFWGKLGAFWGGLFGILFSAAFLAIPVFGHIIVLGPLASMLVSGVSSAALTGGLTALGAALYSIGIPKDSVVSYETAIKADKFLLLVHGTPDEAARAEKLLGTQGAASVESHAVSAAAPGA